MGRLIDANALMEYCNNLKGKTIDANDIARFPTAVGWISVTDGLPNEHDSLFAKHPHFNKYMWAKESDDVIVYVVFPDGTGRATEGRLHDGKWHTKISPTFEPVITHWMPLPEPPKEVTTDD